MTIILSHYMTQLVIYCRVFHGIIEGIRFLLFFYSLRALKGPLEGAQEVFSPINVFL